MRRAGVVLLIWACGGGHMGTLQNEREIVGDTVIVRTLAGSVWDGPRVLEPELRMGVLEGEDAYVFGQVQSLAVDARGGIYVFDGQVPALRYYDADGNWVRNVARDGAGPGEYGNTVIGMTVRSDGRLILHDYRNFRINMYEADGSFATQWRVRSGMIGPNMLTADTADRSYLRILTGPIVRGSPWPVGLEVRDSDGNVIDTLAPPTFADEPEGGGFFTPTKVWAMSPLGYFVAGVSTTYRIDLRRTEGQVVRIERVVDLVSIGSAERSAYEARNDWMRENQGQFLSSPIPPVPDVKPAWHSLRVTDEGRVWVRRSVPGERVEVPEAQEGGPPPVGWRDPEVYDVFEPDGTYLGEVRVPPRTTLHVVRGDAAWGIQRGEFDEQYVVRFRIAAPAGG